MDFARDNPVSNDAPKPDSVSKYDDVPKAEDAPEAIDLTNINLEVPEPSFPSEQPTPKETEKGDTKIEEDEFEIRRKRFFELK